MNTIVFGFDPGLKGGIAVFDCANDRFSYVMGMPVNESGIDVNTLKTFLTKCTRQFPDHRYIAVIEKVGAMPGQGVVSMFTFGEGYGSLKTAVGYVLKTDVVLVTPQSWKKTVLDGYDWKQSVPKPKIPKGTPPDERKAIMKEYNREKAKAKARSKQVGISFIQENYPYVDLKFGHKSEQDGLADACCIALYGRHIVNSENKLQ